ncbi:cytochrome P450 [Pilobolus umbonatus]|nr:cytochrome P450 [Pilobolus umbonatus]
MVDTTLNNQTLTLIGGSTLALLSLLAIKYPDRPPFFEHPPKIPHVAGQPLIGGLFHILSNVHIFHDLVAQQFDRHASMTISSASLGAPPQISTVDPRNIEHILRTNFKNYVRGPEMNTNVHDVLGQGILNSEGENWKSQRKTASFIFSVKNFRDIFTDVFVKEMKVLDAHILDKAAKNHTPIDFQETIFKFTVDSFVYLGFGVQINAIQHEKPVPFAESLDYLQRLVFRRFINPVMPVVEVAAPIFAPWIKSTGAHLKTVNNFIASVIQQRKKEIENKVTGHKDLLAQFMNATNHHGNKLSDEELRDSTINFIIAGRDTTAQALSWLFYNIMLHPRVEKKMMEEINEHITDEVEEDSPAFYEAVRKMPYMHAAFHESLRLHPPIPGNMRCTIADDVWPDGTIIKAGQYISWFPYAQARCKSVWGENAADFYPERWIDENGSLIHEPESKWPVFQAGPRVCLGQKLATLESIVATIMLLRRYSFKLASDQHIIYDASITHPMKHGMKVFLEKR